LKFPLFTPLSALSKEPIPNIAPSSIHRKPSLSDIVVQKDILTPEIFEVTTFGINRKKVVLTGVGHL